MTNTKDFEKMERDGWADPSIAKGYADGFAHATGLVAAHLADAVGARGDTQVLDLCTGHGVVAAELVARGAQVTGLDFSPAMITLAREAVPQATFIQGDAMALDFPDASFDAVTIGFGVPHFPDPAKGLAEAARVLKPGGRIAFSIWRGAGSKGAFGWLFDAVGRLADPTILLPAGPDAHMFTDPDVARPMMAEAGFDAVDMTDLDSKITVSEADHLFDVFDAGAVRAASLLSRQPQDRRDAVRADLAKRVVSQGVKVADGYQVATPSVMVYGMRG